MDKSYVCEVCGLKYWHRKFLGDKPPECPTTRLLRTTFEPKTAASQWSELMQELWMPRIEAHNA